MKNTTLKQRLAEFLAHLEIGQAKFAENVGLSKGFANNVGDSIRVDNLEKIAATYPELDLIWLQTGRGEMLKPESIILQGEKNVQVQGNKAETLAVALHGGTINHNGGKDQVIEKQEQQVHHMFEAFMVELRGFHEYTQRQDDHLDNIVKKSYLRNERNMERMDKMIEQQNELIRMVVEQSQRTQDRADRLLGMLEKKI